MKKTLFTSALILIIISGGFVSNLQAQIQDTELWTELQVDLEFSKKLKMQVEAGYRIDSMVQRPSEFLIEPSLEYELVKNLDLSISYRRTTSFLDDNENRLSTNLSYKLEVIPKTDISWRVKFQHDRKMGEVENNLRNKLDIDYNLSKPVDPFIGFEHFYRIDQREPEQYRLIFGLEFNLPKGMSTKVYYMRRTRFNVRNEGNFQVFGLGFDFGNLELFNRD